MKFIHILSILAALFFIFGVSHYFRFLYAHKNKAITHFPRKLRCIFSNGFEIRNVAGDGSCFYHSVLFLVSKQYRESSNELDRRHQVVQLRTQVADSITKQIWLEVYSPFISFEQLQHNLRKYHVWASNVEWKCVCDFLNINILFLRMKTDSLYCGWGIDNLKKGQKILFIANQNDNHYNPVILQKQSSIQCAFYYDSPKVKHMIQQLQSMCH